MFFCSLKRLLDILSYDIRSLTSGEKNLWVLKEIVNTTILANLSLHIKFKSSIVLRKDSDTDAHIYLGYFVCFQEKDYSHLCIIQPELKTLHPQRPELLNHADCTKNTMCWKPFVNPAVEKKVKWIKNLDDIVFVSHLVL